MESVKIYELAKTKGCLGVTAQEVSEFLALAAIQKWLMDEHNIFLAVLPGFGGYSFIAGKNNNFRTAPNSFNLGGYKTWMDCYKTAISEALELV